MGGPTSAIIIANAVTAGWGSKGQIPHQIINASCRAKPERGGGREDDKEGEGE